MFVWGWNFWKLVDFQGLLWERGIGRTILVVKNEMYLSLLHVSVRMQWSSFSCSHFSLASLQYSVRDDGPSPSVPYESYVIFPLPSPQKKNPYRR